MRVSSANGAPNCSSASITRLELSRLASINITGCPRMPVSGQSICPDNQVVNPNFVEDGRYVVVLGIEHVR